MNKFTKFARQSKTNTFLRFPRIVEEPAAGQFLHQGAAVSTIMADGGQYLDADYGDEDKEVKLNLRFCDNSCHDPLIHFDFKQFTPDVSETKSRTYTRQQCCPEDLLTRLWDTSLTKRSGTRTVAPHSMDSVMNAIFTAFDYDIKCSNGASDKKD